MAVVLFFDHLQGPCVAEEVASSNCHGRAAVYQPWLASICRRCATVKIASGDKRTCGLRIVMSAITSNATKSLRRASRRFGPLSDKVQCSKAAYSITSLALACSVSGTVSPSPLAVFLLITSTNLLGNWTGRSAGLAPLKMRSMYPAA